MPDEIARQTVAKTEGVPAFVEELTKTVLEYQAFFETPATATSSRPAPPLSQNPEIGAHPFRPDVACGRRLRQRQPQSPAAAAQCSRADRASYARSESSSAAPPQTVTTPMATAKASSTRLIPQTQKKVYLMCERSSTPARPIAR